MPCSVSFNSIIVLLNIHTVSASIFPSSRINLNPAAESHFNMCLCCLIKLLTAQPYTYLVWSLTRLLPKTSRVITIGNVLRGD